MANPYLTISFYWLFSCILTISKAQEHARPYLIQEQAAQNQKASSKTGSMYLFGGLQKEILNNFETCHSPINHLHKKSQYLTKTPNEPSIRPRRYSGISQKRPFWKLSTSLRQTLGQGQIPQAKRFLIKTNPGSVLDRSLLSNPLYVAIQKQYANYTVLETTWETVQGDILTLPQVEAVEEMPYLPYSESLVRDMNLFVNRINYVQALDSSLNGQGLLVSIQEPLYDIEDADLRNRHRPSDFQSDELDPHATDMATIVAGAGNISLLGRGVAWGAELSSSDNQHLLPASDKYYQSQNIYVQNHSYGSPIDNNYSNLAQAFDLSAWQNPNLLHIFSVGNEGLAQSTQGPYANIPQYATITGSYKMAKNVLLVGSVDEQNQADPFVSRGPSYDGRIKPDLSAASLSGSSNAAALVSGISLLMQQAFLRDNPSKAMTSALVRAFLINSADDIGAKGPDFITGFGNVNARKALALVQDRQYREGNLQDAQVDTISILLPENAQNLKVTLAWTDREGVVESSLALVNDLDLQILSDQDELVGLPWVLNSYPHADSLAQLAKPGEDHRNTVEQAQLLGALATEYKIVVKAYSIPEGKQDYALAYSWETPDQFIWTYPTRRDALPFDDQNQALLRWETSYEETQSASLDLSLDAGQNWSSLEASLDLSQSFYNMAIPYTSTQAQLRINIAGKEYLSDIFSLSREPNLSFGFICSDSVLLQWDPIVGIQDYLLLAPGTRYLDTLLSTQDTALVLNKQLFPQDGFGIMPRWPGNTPAQASSILNLDQQNLNCYLVGFSVIGLDSSQGIQLEVELSSTYQVAEVVFERENTSSFLPIAQIRQLDSARVVFRDQSPREGLNRYQARIRFQNGGEILTSSDIGYFVRDKPIFLYPNPLSRDDLLTLVRRNPIGENFIFRINNAQGDIVFERRLSPENSALALEGLQSGMYFYSIIEGSLVQKGKLLILE